MKIINPLKMNDWNIKHFLCIVLYFQFLVWVLIGVEIIGIEIPVLRQLTCIIYLTLIPGLLILRILKLHKLSNIESILYSVGLSISTLMFVGFFINMVYPLFGIDDPISTRYLIVTMSLVVLVLSTISYIQDKQYSDPEFIDLSDIFCPKFLFFLLVFLVAILGAYFINLYDAHFIYLLLVLLIILIAIVIECSDFFPQKLYPIAIFVSTISLLLSNSLISNYLRGWDIQIEYYLSNLVIKNSFWDYSNSLSNVNCSLSVILLAPIFSIVSSIDLIHIFKIIYPFIYSLVPIGLYQIFQTQLQNKKLSFLSVFFFISFFVFYTEMLQLARQQIAELYLVLVLLLFFDDTIPKVQKKILLIVFISSVCVSHYGLTYIFLFLLIAVICLLEVGPKLNCCKKLSADRITKNFVLLFAIIAFAWYIYISSSSAFITFIKTGYEIYSKIFTEFLNPEFSEGLSLIMIETPSFVQSISKLLHMTTLFFISIGVINLFIKYIPLNWSKEYIALCLTSYMLLVASIIAPFLSNAYNTARIYQISLIFLSPLCIIGGITFFKLIYSLLGVTFNQKCLKKPICLLMIFFATFMLFNTGFVSDVVDNRIFSYIYPPSDNFQPCFYDQEFICANWIFDVKNTEPIYADKHRSLLLKSINWTEAFDLPANIEFDANDSDVIVLNTKDSYLYLGTLNILEQKFLISYSKEGEFIDDYLKLDSYDYNDKIYSNGGAEVFN